jgi:hypothetical protein
MSYATSKISVLVVAVGIVALCPAGRSAPVRDGAAVAAQQMEALWNDLEKEEAVATRALLRLSAKPAEAVAFLKETMKPLRIEAERVKSLLAKLGSDKDDIWKPAFEELEYFDPRLAIDLTTLMNDVTESPARQRMVAVLSGRLAERLEGKTVSIRPLGGGGDGFNFFDGRGSWWAEHKVERLNRGGGDSKKKWTRAVRAIVLLEHIGTPDAVIVLRSMATGHLDAQPTKEARAALDRLAAKNR